MALVKTKLKFPSFRSEKRLTEDRPGSHGSGAWLEASQLQA